MERVIAKAIIEKAQISIEEGQMKYLNYFRDSSPYYAQYKEKTDAILIKKGYAEVIVIKEV